MKRLFILALLLLPTGLWAQSAAVKKIMEMAREDNRTMQHLDILCNRFGGRPVGSDAYDNAADWAVKQFQSWGLEVSVEKVGETCVGFNRGGWWGRAMGEYTETLYFTTPSYTSGTKGPQRGHVVIEPRTWDEFNRMKGTLKGAWVLLKSKSTGWPLDHDAKAKERRHAAIKENEEIAKQNREAGVDGKKRPLNEMPALFYDEMVEAGVLGFIQPTTVPIRTLYDRNMINDGTTTFEQLPTVPDIKLDEAQFERIYKLAEQRRYVELEFDIRNYFKMGPVPYHNVVATMKGSKYPDEYVILGAHLDAYDSATGGVDCGSGVSAVMEAARMLSVSGAKPERSIIFILFAGEEFGLLGSLKWIEDHPEKLDKISNVFNRDGGPMPYTAFYAPASLVKEYEKIAKPIQELYPSYNFTINKLEPRSVPTSLGGNDATSFMVKGIPAVQMAEWSDPMGYNFDYHEIWHTERDTYQKSIPEYQEQAATALAIMALGTANLPTILPRNEVYK
ncbi:MAG: M20/M25/M40 family metallo-hydrolase [Alistipes sp.]|jgi:hypothetical protein|nr:M20/M25/M40 family metallo-hydrolase [Alistipes sp.]